MVERIKRALELARAERELARQGLPPATAPIGGAAAATLSQDTTGRLVRSRELVPDKSWLQRERILMPGLTSSTVGGGAVAAQGYKMLRTQVLQRMQARGWNTLALMSPTPGDGKTLTAINLAIAISADVGHSALLVDFDLRRPSVAPRLGIVDEMGPGIETCLAGETPIGEVFTRLVGYERLMFLCAGKPVLGSSELLAAAKTRAIVQELKAQYADRIVLFDLPPVLGGDDAVAFAPQVDAVLLVIAEGHTKTEDISRTFELLRDKPVVGTVLNRSRSDFGAEYAY